MPMLSMIHVNTQSPDKIVYRKLDLQESTDAIVVNKLRHVDVRLAQKSITDANVGNPLALYILDTPDKEKRRRGSKAFFNVAGRMNFHYFISSKRTIAFTVHHGIATVLAAYAPSSKEGKKGLFDRIVGRLTKHHEKALLYFLSPEQGKRYKEVVTKLEKLVSTLGDDGKDMIPLISLGTAPAYQHRGYGGALVEAINTIADSQGRKVQLISSNIDNTEFYNSHGYFTTATVALGEDNPTWDKEPVIVSLMVRGGDDEEKFSERKI